MSGLTAARTFVCRTPRLRVWAVVRLQVRDLWASVGAKVGALEAFVLAVDHLADIMVACHKGQATSREVVDPLTTAHPTKVVVAAAVAAAVAEVEALVATRRASEPAPQGPAAERILICIRNYSNASSRKKFPATTAARTAPLGGRKSETV